MFGQDDCLDGCGAGVSSGYLDRVGALVVCELLFVVQGHVTAVREDGVSGSGR